MIVQPFSYLQAVEVAVAQLSPVIDSDTKLFLDSTNAASYPGTGNTWFDVSGNSNNANVTEIASYFSVNAFDFPGTDYTKIGTVTHNANLNVFDGNFSVIFVGSIDATGTVGAQTDLAGPFAKFNWNDNPGIGNLFIRNSSDGNFKKTLFYLNGGSVGLSTGLAFASIGDFFVLQVVRSGSNVQYYNSANTSIGSFTSSTNGNNTNNLVIGRGRNISTTNYRWDGKIAGLGIYDKALTADERLQNINYFKSKLGF